MSTHWICRAYQPGDEVGISELYRRVFQLQMSPELWRWMYQAPPSGPAVIVVISRDDELIGHYAVQPRRFWLAGSKATFGLAVGTMIVPEFRSVQTLVEMAQLAYQLCRGRGFSSLYAFPNDAAHRVRCALLGWKAFPEIIEWDGLAPNLNRPAASNAQIWREVPRQIDFASLFASLEEESLSANHPVQAARSLAWLRWRFFDRPANEYRLHTVESNGQIVGYAVSKQYIRDEVNYGHILDFQMVAAADRWADLLDSIWRQFSEWNVQRVSCWTRGHLTLGNMLASVGLTPTGKKTNFCCLDLIGASATKSAQNQGWQVTMADSDIY